MLLADGLDTPGLYEDAVYGAATFAVLANMVMIAALVYIAVRLRRRAATVSHGTFLAILLFIGALIAVHAEQALHAYLRYGASWQVSEHGILFLAGWTAGTVGLALTVPWDGTGLASRWGRKKPARAEVEPKKQPQVGLAVAAAALGAAVLVLAVGIGLGVAL